MQAASVYSTIANGGVRIEPTPGARHQGTRRALHPGPKPEKNRVVSAKTAKTLAQMLESVVDDEEGTGTKARIPGYRVAGKTGTANRVDPATGKYKGYTSSFAGFAPADKPRITVYCAIQNATKGSYFGGQICGPIYKQVMEFALKTLQVPPTGAKAAAAARHLHALTSPPSATSDQHRERHQEPPRDNDHPRVRGTRAPTPAPHFARGGCARYAHRRATR